jgi:hypothetical protein
MEAFEKEIRRREFLPYFPADHAVNPNVFTRERRLTCEDELSYLFLARRVRVMSARVDGRSSRGPR